MVNVRVSDEMYSLNMYAPPSNQIQGTRIYLPAAPYLLGRKIRSIVVHNLSGSGAFSLGGVRSTYLTLQDANKRVMLDNYVLIDLWSDEDPVSSYNSRRARLFNLFNVDTTKSYIQIYGASILAGAPICTFNFYLEKNGN